MEVMRILGAAVPAITGSYGAEHRLIGRALADGAVLECLIGSGATADVFAARGSGEGEGECSDRQATKVFKEGYVLKHPGRVRHEMLVHGLIRHPNVVPMISGGFDSSLRRFVVSMPLAPLTLCDLVGRGPLHVPEAIRIISGILDALAAVHGLGLVHADVKISNILIGEDFRPLLSDFGLASFSFSNNGRRPAEGSPESIAPERLLGRPYDHRTDIYSAGVVIYELLAGRPPFVVRKADDAYQHVSCEPPPLSLFRPGVSRSLEDIIFSCLSKCPGKRPNSAAGLKQEAVGALLEMLAAEDEIDLFSGASGRKDDQAA